MEKVPKRNIPVIFIGLGGTGREAVLAIKEKFGERLIREENGSFRRTAFLVLDSDMYRYSANGLISDDEFVSLYHGNLAGLLKPQNRDALPEYIKAWFSPYITPNPMPDFFAPSRQLARLLLFLCIQQFREKFMRAANACMQMDAAEGEAPFKANVVICGGLAGNTGSGIFLDVAYLVRQWLREGFPAICTSVYGFFALPDAIMNRAYAQQDPAHLEWMKANAYAALKEMDYWMNDSDPDSKMQLEQRYGYGIQAKWEKAPFDLAFLMDGRQRDGRIDPDPRARTVQTIADMMVCCCADTPNAFSTTSIVHSVKTEIWMINHSQKNSGSRVNYVFSSLGVSTTEAMEQMAEACVTGLVLDRVLFEPLVNDDQSVFIDEAALEDSGAGTVLAPKPYFDRKDNARALYRHLLGDTLVFNEAQSDDDCFQNMMRSELQEFSVQNRYSPMEPCYQQIVDANDALFAENIKRYAGNSEMENTWDFNAKNAVDRMLYQEKQRFEASAKAAIQDIHVGPVSWLNFLRDTLLPRLEWLRDAWDGENGADSQQYNSACDQAKALSASLRSRGLLSKAFTFATSKSTLEDYANHEHTAVVGRRNGIYSGWRRNGLTQLIKYVTNYIRTLSFMLEALKGISQQSEERLQVKGEKNQLVTVESLQAYLNGQGAAKDLAVAAARDNIWAWLAEESFHVDLQHPLNFERNQYEQRDSLTRQVKDCVNSAESMLRLDNLDWILRAVLPGDDQIMRNAREEYAANTLYPWLRGNAEPLLEEWDGGYDSPNAAQSYAFLSVPLNAVTLRDGFSRRTNAVAQSFLTGGICCICLRTGLAAANLACMSDLNRAYTAQAGRSPKYSAGRHLVESVPINARESDWQDMRYNWYWMPDLLSGASPQAEQ